MWFKVDDKFHAHRKTRRALRSHPTKRKDVAALGMWVAAGSWCGDNMSDGFVPESVIETFDDDWAAIAGRLVESEFFEPGEMDGEPGWWLVNFCVKRPGRPQWNQSRAEILGERYDNKMRQALHRDRDLVDAIKERDQDRCRYCGTAVQWNVKRGAAAATYDHVKPITDGGLNTLENVVVACKRCNDRKNKRTLRDAGMKLLPPGSLGAPVLDDDLETYSVRTERRSGKAEVDGRVGSGRVGSGRGGSTYSVRQTDPGP